MPPAQEADGPRALVLVPRESFPRARMAARMKGMIRNNACSHAPRLHGLLAVMAATFLTSCGAAPKEESTAPPLPGIEALVRDQAGLYPMMGPEDLYKLVYQATRGPGHLFMGTNSELEEGLSQEIARMPPSPIEGEPLVEGLDQELNLARINLRPWLLAGGTTKDLARAMGWTTLKYRGDRAALVSSLAAAREVIHDLPLTFKAKDFDKVVTRMKAKEYPPGAHSEDYATAYEPAYRLVLLHHLTDPDFGGRDGVITFVAWPEHRRGSP